MKSISRIIVFVLSYVLLTTIAFAHPGHNHAELTVAELFGHMFAWGILLVTLLVGIWLLNYVRNQRIHARQVKSKLLLRFMRDDEHQIKHKQR